MIAYIGEYNLSESKNNIIKHANLDWSDQSEPYSTQFCDVYFNNNQGLKESQYVFFDGNKLSERWETFSQPLFCIVETGFGSGLNFLNTASQFLTFKLKNKNTPLQRLHFISFEKYPLSLKDLQRTLTHFPQFKTLIETLMIQYPMPLVGCHRLTFDHGNIILDLWFGDINEQIDKLTNQYQLSDTPTQLPDRSQGIADAWYLDGFNPSKNPEMWHSILFEKIYKCSKHNATLATFTAAGFVRRGLIAAGFDVEKRKGYGQKREMLIAKKQVQKFNQLTSTKTKDIAIIGGGIASLCMAVSLATRGHKVTLYCADKKLGERASGNLQGALYPLLNQQHNELSQLFSNAYLYALHFYRSLNLAFPFAHQFNGLIQLAYDAASTAKLRKINEANFPPSLVTWIDQQKCDQLAGIPIGLNALYYPEAGWLSPREVIQSLALQLNTFKQVEIKCSHKINTIKHVQSQWLLFNEQNACFKHEHLIIAAGLDTLTFPQCHAIPLSAARGQVSHINSNNNIAPLQRTLCHEGYLTPGLNNQHCMGATFKRHRIDCEFSAQEQAENHQKLKKCIPDQPWVETITTNQQAHVAIRCTTRDHFPYVGQLTDYEQLKKDYQSSNITELNVKSLPNIYVLTGLGSRGLCTAPLIAEILASVIDNECLPISNDIYEKMQIPRQWLNYIAKNKPLTVQKTYF